MKKILLALAITVATVLQPALAYDFSAEAPSGQTLYYNITNMWPNEVTVTYPNGNASLYNEFYAGYTKPTSNLVIPDTVTYQGVPYSVTSIGNGAFYNCNGLTSVTIPNSVASIGDDAFSGCTGLTSIAIPYGVPSIGSSAFSGCTGLTSVTIPNSVTYIGSFAFSGCTSLASVSIPNSVTYIGNYAFSMCTGLTSITISNSVTYIGENAFWYCTGLTSVSIPNGVTYIGSSAFEACSGLTSVTIPDSITTIEHHTFCGCSGLTSITIPNSVTYIGDAAFGICTNLTFITIPNSVTSIGSSAFSGTGLTSITIPNSVTSIGDYVFYECYNLSKVYFKEINPPSIGNNTFDVTANLYVPCEYLSNYQNASQWSNYSSRIYGKNYEWEPSYNFVVNDSLAGSIRFLDMDCDSNVVVTVNINEGCQFMGWSDGETDNPRTFHITGDTTVTAIIYNPFFSAVAPSGQILNYRINDSTTVELYYSCVDGALIVPDNVMHPNTGVVYTVNRVGEYAFRECHNLTSVVIPNSVTSIGNSAFEYCGQLSTVELGSSITSIEDWIFSGCNNLDSVYLKGTFPPPLQWHSFNGCENVEFYVPCQYLNNYLSSSDWINMDYASRTYSNNYDNWEHSYNFVVNDNSLGSVSFTGVCDSNIVVTVNTNEGYEFLGWSDGGTGNPRTFHLTGDTMVTAFIGTPYFSAVAPSGQTLYYRIIDNTNDVEVISQNTEVPYYSDGGPAGALIIPDSVTNPNTGISYIVSNIGYYAFGSCHYLTSVLIPNTVTSIEDGAFDWCDGLSSVVVGNNITSIGSYAFYACGNLINIVLPESLTTIEDNAFLYSGLSKVYFKDTLPPNIEYSTFFGCNANLYVPCQSVSSYQSALFWSDISSRIYGKNYDWEPSYNFVVNDSLAGSISFTEIDCDSNVVVTVNVNEGYTLIGWSDGGTGNPRTFHITNDTMVTAIIVNRFFSAIAPSGQTLYYNIVDNNRVVVVNQNNTMWEPFYSDGAPAGALIIPDSVTHPVTGIIYVVDSIGDNAFAGCNNLTSVIIPNSVISIGNGAFQFSGLLSHIEFGNSITTIGRWAFSNCTGLFGDIIFPKSLIAIGEGTFNQCERLGSVTFQNSLVAIGNDCFWNCYSLSNIYLTDTFPPSITYSTFSGCNANFYVPCQHISKYYSALVWNNDLSSRIFVKNFWEHSYNFVVNDSILGGLSFTEIDCDSNVVVTVSENIGCQLIGWSDGGIGNPRTFHLTNDTMVTAILDYIPYSVIVEPNDTLRGIVSGSDTVHYGDTVVIAATANYGYHFSRWNDGNTNNPRYVTITQDMNFTAIFDKNNYNIALSADSNIHGYMSGMGNYEYLDNRTISANANHGYHFTHWNDGDTNNPRIITLTQDTAFTAYFAKNIYTTIVQSSDTIRGSAMGDTVTEYLNIITISATSNYGYHFSRWNDYNTDNPRLVTVTHDTTYVAVFDKNIYNIDFIDTNINGNIMGLGSYEYLDTCSITAVPNYGYHFTHWNDGDTNNPRIITLTQDTAFTAYFAKNIYTLIVQSNDTTLGEVSGSTVCEYLDTISISATATMPHYHFVQWSDGNTNATRNIVVNSDSVIVAIFAIDTHSVVVTVNNESYGSVNGTCNVPYGTTVTIEATASDGYHFAEWSNGSRNNPDNITIVSDTVITAIFTDDVVPQICMVSVQNGYNTVIWEKGLKVASYNIYREGNTANQYELLSTVTYDSLSTWVDSISNPRSRSYRYRMTTTDIYGYESEASDVHKTMHLTINKGIGNQWNLVWTEYEGAPYTTYVIYRGTNASNIQQIDVMPAGGNTTYTDENAPEGDVYFQVGVMMSSPCNPSKSSSIIMSNIATNGNVGIQNIDLTDVNIFSRMGEIIVENPSGKSIQVLDAVGRIIYITNNTSYNDSQVSISVPKSGVYLVKVGDSPAKKVVVVK